MEQVKMILPNGEEKQVDIVRYFQMNGTIYGIYTLNEVDANGYVKLYVFSNKNGAFVSPSDEEWNNVKGTIKQIVKEARAGEVQVIEDLDYHVLENAKVDEQRVFKLAVAVKDALGSNKKIFTEVTNDVAMPTENVSVDSENDDLDEIIDYEELYKSEMEKQEMLKKELVEATRSLKEACTQLEEMMQE